MSGKPWKPDDARRLQTPGAGAPWAKGQSGNPGGRCSSRKALETIGLTASELTAETWQALVKAMRELDPGDKDESASWRFAVQQILDRLEGKPKESVDLNVGGPSPEQQALIDAIRMTPHERRQAIAQDATLPDAPE